MATMEAPNPVQPAPFDTLPDPGSGRLGPIWLNYLRAYLGLRLSRAESFIDAFRRVGADPFKAALYPEEGARDAA